MTWFNSFATYTLVGILLGIGFVIPQLWWLVFFGVALLLLQLQTLVKRQWAWVWYAWGIKYLFSLYWGWTVYPIDWLGMSLGAFQLVGIAFYWITAVVWLGSGAFLFVRVYQFLQQKKWSCGLLFVPFLWLGAELFGALIFSITTYGQGATIGSQFSFGFIGYHAAQHPWLIQSAQVAGVYGLTVVVVAAAAFALFIWKTQRKAIVVVLVLLLIVSGFVPSVTAERAVGEMITVAVIDTDIDPNYRLTVEDSIKKTKQLQAAYAVAQQQEADYIIFPEDSRFFDHTLGTTALAALLSFQSKPTDAMVLDSSRVTQNNSTVLQSIWFDPDTTRATFAHKSYLVPQGEFMPYLYFGLLRLVGFAEMAETLGSSFSYVQGDLTIQSHFSEHTPGVLFCFEGVDPQGVKKITQSRETAPPFVAHIVSHGWFNEPKTLWPQLESMLRVQAIWNDTYIVSAGNSTVGYTVSPSGQVLYPQVVAEGDLWQVGTIEF